MKIKECSQTTMNELLGMYGYEKFHTRDTTQGLNLRNNQFESSNDPSLSAAASSSTSSSVTHANRISNASKYKDIIITADDSHSASSPTSGSVGGSVDGRASVCRTPSPFTAEAYTENNGNGSKDLAEDDQSKPPGCIVCSWCQKVGMKLFTLRTGNGCKAFCSELCFTQCRRASFKKNKICDWCKHVRHTVNYVDFQDGEQQLQFCSNKCLNQYKMHIFCNETQAHLQLHPHLNDSSASKAASNKVTNLITPDLWLKDFKNGENESSSINSYRDSSDADSEADNEDSPPIVPHSIKRKLSEFSTEQNETNLSKGSKVKNNQKHKNNKETKRHKQSSSSSGALSQNSNRFPINKNLHIKNEWFGRESRDNAMPSFQSPPHLPIGRFSPPTNPAMRATIVTHNQQHIPLINGTPVNLRTTAPPIHGIPSIALSSQMFPRVAGNMGLRPELLRPPLIHNNMFSGTPMPNLSPAHMEMLLRMQSGLSGLRHPFPYPPHAPTSGHPFTAMASMPVGAHHSGGQPLVHPSPQTSVSTPLTANASLLPPVTIMMPYPVPIPLPIPIPIPILFPINKTNGSETNTTNDNICSNGNNNYCNNILNVTNNSKIESVITKLVEKNKTKTANNNNVVGYHRSNHHNHNDNDSPNGDNSLDLTRKDNTNVVFKNNNNHNENNNELQNQKSDNSTETSFPQNLIVSRNKRCVGTTITSNVDNGYRVQ